jgi:hypothetical protein
LSALTGLSLPTASVQWVADEADRAGLVDLDHGDLSHAADALAELHATILEERRGAEAMGEAPPKIRGGRAGLRALIIAYLEGKKTWLDRSGHVYQARDAARAREQEHEALLTPEQRDRRGLPRLQRRRDASPTPTETAAPPLHEAGPLPVTPAATAKPHEQTVAQLRGRIGLLGARVFAELAGAKRAELEAERTNAERKLAALLKRGPPD